MAKKEAKKTTYNRTTTKADLMIALLSANTQEARVNIISTLMPSKNIVRRATQELRDRPEVCSVLEEYAASQGYTAFARRGRYAPKVGETRVYNVQKIKDDISFIRLPLSSLSVKKGSKVRVDFEEGGIVVRPALPAKS